MNEVIALLILLSLMHAGSLVMTASMFAAHVRAEEIKRWEREAEAAIDAEIDAELLRSDIGRDRAEEAERRERETSAAFDEGINNIMSYAVRGKTGLDG